MGTFILHSIHVLKKASPMEFRCNNKTFDEPTCDISLSLPEETPMFFCSYI